MDTTIREAIVPFFRQVRVVPLQPVRGEMGESELFGPQGFQDNHDLHSHPQQGVAGSPESGGMRFEVFQCFSLLLHCPELPPLIAMPIRAYQG